MLAREILFISDSVVELDAAKTAGMSTVLCARADAAQRRHDHVAIQSFDELGKKEATRQLS